MKWIMVPFFLIWSVVGYIAGIAGIGAHILATYIAYSASGVGSAILTLVTPVISEIYWLYQLNKVGAEFFPFLLFLSAIWVIGEAVPWLLVILIGVFSRD